MSGNASNYLAKKVADHVLGNTAYTAPATVYIGLWTATLDDTSTGATAGEVSGGSYARVAVTNNTTNWPNAAGNPAVKSSGADFSFPTPTANWGTVTYAAILDSATLGAGNILFWFPLAASKTVNNGDTPVKFASGSIAVTMSGTASNYLDLAMLDHILGNTAYTAPSTVYAGLWTATLSDSSTGSTAGEVSGGSYARKSITNNTTNWPNATGSTSAAKSNGTAITFVDPTAGWGTVTYQALLDASSAGNILFYGALTVSKTINSGDTPVQFASTAWALTVD